MIIPVYKPFGESTHQLAQKLGKIYQQKSTHTGTLDPAADGVVVVLTSEDRYKKEEFANTTKYYTAQILLGISTDTEDMVGLPQEGVTTFPELKKKDITSTFQSLTGHYSQTLPRFSAKRIQGESYFDLAKRGESISLAQQNIKISEINLHSQTTISLNELNTYYTTKIFQIKGDFRQEEIRKQWQQFINDLKGSSQITDLPLITVSIVCSKRTYIRALVRDFSHSIQIPAVLYSLTRTQNGPYSIADCTCLV